jgi:predicted component of viral defense system (DUF524 family)
MAKEEETIDSILPFHVRRNSKKMQIVTLAADENRALMDINASLLVLSLPPELIHQVMEQEKKKKSTFRSQLRVSAAVVDISQVRIPSRSQKCMPTMALHPTTVLSHQLGPCSL